MNIVVIFAGGTGKRMNTVDIPKQFLIVHGKPIIVHTIEHFQKCYMIDEIIVVSLVEYIDKIYEYKDNYNLTKIVDVVGGGQTGQESIYNGLRSAKKFSNSADDIVLIHDGVRPIIDDETIINNINTVKKYGNAITVAKSVETALIVDDSKVENVIDRSKCYLGRAPQSFYLKDILDAHNKAKNIKKNDFIDSAMLMKFFGYELHIVYGPQNNIKITTPIDFFMFKAILDAKENEQIKVG